MHTCVCVYTASLCPSLLLLLVFEEIVAEHGEAGHQGDVLLEVHSSVSISVQVLKDLIQRCLVCGFLFNNKKNTNRLFQLPACKFC